MMDAAMLAQARRMAEAAAAGKQVVPGKALGDAPEFFLVGDEPMDQDLITGVPFSGKLNVVLISALDVLFRKYGAREDKMYVTYLVKSVYKPGELTEEMVLGDWLPALQAEYQASGCSAVVAVGSVAKMVQGHVGLKNPALKARPGLLERVRQAWQILSA